MTPTPEEREEPGLAYKLVPAKPTAQMILAGLEAHWPHGEEEPLSNGERLGCAYTAMLGAAPQPVAGNGQIEAWARQADCIHVDLDGDRAKALERLSAFAALAAVAGNERSVITDARILHIWDTHVGEPTASLPLTDADKISFARAVLAGEAATQPAYRHVGECATDDIARQVCEAIYEERVADNLALCEALRAVYALYGEDKQVKTIVHDAIRKHGVDNE
jgi:hypothetical protein